MGSRYVAYVALLDSGNVALLWLDPRLLRFRYIPGYRIPEHSPALPQDNEPGTWVPRMAAAFNGGFWLRDLHPGGYFYAGTTVRALAAGQGSMVVTNGGRLMIGQWGRDFSSTSGLQVVRQDFPLLVNEYVDESATRGPDGWGGSNTGPFTARSAIGELADGGLVYAYGHRVLPSQLAAALMRVHVRNAMILDMNGTWPAAFTYVKVGSQLIGSRIQSRIHHDPSVYFSRYQKDFVVAELP